MSDRPKIAFWFRYGPAEHSELFHAFPHIVASLAKQAEVHYYGMKSTKAIPGLISENATIHLLPFHVKRTNDRDKLLKTLLWIICLPFVALHARLIGVRAVYIDETIPLTGLIGRMFFGKHVAVTVADMFVDIYFKGSTAAIGRMIRAIDLWTWKQLPLIFTRAGATKKWLVTKGVEAGRVHPVYDPCDLKLYHPLPASERKSCRADLGYRDDEIILVHHGILHPNKGNDLIIRAVAELRGQFPQLRYLLVGDGAEMEKLKRLVAELKVEDICRLTGWLPTLPEVNRALNAGDIGLVMRTGAESDDFHMTGALVHNMACGLPVLAARLGGVSEVVFEHHNGLLFDPRDMREFKEKLITLIQRRELRENLGAAAAADARVHFDMQRVVTNTVDPLLALAGIRVSPPAIILLGGKGTRIAALYGDRPKCLVPVAGKPFLQWQLEWLKRGGVRRVHLAAGHMADVLVKWLETDAPKDMEITYSVEPEPRGTGGAIKYVEPWISGEMFFVLNGDSLTPNLNFQALEIQHGKRSNNWNFSKASVHDQRLGKSLALPTDDQTGGRGSRRAASAEQLITIAVTRIEKTGRYGTVEFDAQDRVTAFLEKADRESGWINTGIYCVSRKVLEHIAPDQNISIETALFPALAAQDHLGVFRTDPPMLDMGTPEGLQEMGFYLSVG